MREGEVEGVRERKGHSPDKWLPTQCTTSQMSQFVSSVASSLQQLGHCKTMHRSVIIQMHIHSKIRMELKIL